MRPLTAEITIDGRTLIAAGHAPFQVYPVGAEHWMVTGRDGDNCVARRDGLRAIFDNSAPAILLCQELNRQAAR